MKKSSAIFGLLVLAALALSPLPARAQSMEDCPRRSLGADAVRGTYLGRECPQGTCQVVLRLDSGEMMRLVDELGEAQQQLGPVGERVEVIYEIVAAWNLVTATCEDSFIFASGQPAQPGGEDEYGNPVHTPPPPQKEEDCPPEVLSLEEASGFFVGESCPDDCYVNLDLDDGRRLRLVNPDGPRQVNVRQQLGRPGDRVVVRYEQGRGWNRFRGVCENRDRLVAGRPVDPDGGSGEAAEEGTTNRRRFGDQYSDWW